MCRASELAAQLAAHGLAPQQQDASYLDEVLQQARALLLELGSAKAFCRPPPAESSGGGARASEVEQLARCLLEALGSSDASAPKAVVADAGALPAKQPPAQQQQQQQQTKHGRQLQASTEAVPVAAAPAAATRQSARDASAQVQVLGREPLVPGSAVASAGNALQPVVGAAAAEFAEPGGAQQLVHCLEEVLRLAQQQRPAPERAAEGVLAGAAAQIGRFLDALLRRARGPAEAALWGSGGPPRSVPESLCFVEALLASRGPGGEGEEAMARQIRHYFGDLLGRAQAMRQRREDLPRAHMEPGARRAACRAQATAKEDHVLDKTRVCKYFLRGRCKLGRECTFAHGKQQLRPQPNLFRTRLCMDYLAGGRCDFGAACRYAHSAEEVRPRGVAGEDVGGAGPRHGEAAAALARELGVVQKLAALLWSRLRGAAGNLQRGGETALPAAAPGRAGEEGRPAWRGAAGQGGCGIGRSSRCGSTATSTGMCSEGGGGDEGGAEEALPVAVTVKNTFLAVAPAPPGGAPRRAGSAPPAQWRGGGQP